MARRTSRSLVRVAEIGDRRALSRLRDVVEEFVCEIVGHECGRCGRTAPIWVGEGEKDEGRRGPAEEMKLELTQCKDVRSAINGGNVPDLSRQPQGPDCGWLAYLGSGPGGRV